MSKLGSKRRKESRGGQSQRSKWTIDDAVAEKHEGLLYSRRRTRANLHKKDLLEAIAWKKSRTECERVLCAHEGCSKLFSAF